MALRVKKHKLITEVRERIFSFVTHFCF